METIKINEIKKVFSVRKLNEKYIEFLVKEFEKNGYQRAYPISITSDNILWDGSHRLEAAKRVGWDKLPAIIETPENIRIAAHERNRAATNALPETFVDHAEEIWGMLAEGKTQQQVADEIGWSLDKVKKYNALNKIYKNVWEKVTEFIKFGTFVQNNDGTIKVTDGTFSENLLRSILNLSEHFQLQIINELISGKINKNQFKNKAKDYKKYDEFVEYVKENLQDADKLKEFIEDCQKGLYKDIERVIKAVDHENELYQEKNMIQIINSDCFDYFEKIKDESIDILLTDPPYGILDHNWDNFDSKEEYLEFSRQWISLAISKIKSSGRIYIFWSQEYMFDFPFDAINENFIFSNMLIWNYKNNIKPNDQKRYKFTYEPIFYFYGKDAKTLNLAKNKEWDQDYNDYDVFTIAQPQENFSDKKIHPAQKPLKLIEQLIEIGSDIGDIILDPFCGSGTVGIAAKKLKRKALLIEKDADSFKKAVKRITDGQF